MSNVHLTIYMYINLPVQLRFICLPIIPNPCMCWLDLGFQILVIHRLFPHHHHHHQHFEAEMAPSKQWGRGGGIHENLL